MDETFPYQPHSETSKAAAEAPEDREAQRQKVLNLIRECGSVGATDDEIDAVLGLGLNSVRPRRTSLAQAGLIVRNGEARRTRRGRGAAVWVAVEWLPRIQSVERPEDTGVPTVVHGDWRDLAERVEACDLLCTDPPYSAKTHEGQCHGRRNELSGARYVSARGIPYPHWSPEDVAQFVETWSPRTRGWFVAMTDSELARAWERSLRDAGRLVFAPIPIVQIGMNVRLAGDGPSNWTVWMIVARPKGKEWTKWGTLRGAYIGNPFDVGGNTTQRHTRSVGGKPLWLMEQIIRDYSRPGDLVCDPCCGHGTTLEAAERTGRRAIGSDLDPDQFRKAEARVSRATQRPLFEE